MAVREFNGTSDTVVFSVGGLANMDYGTLAFLFKTATTTGGRQLFQAHTSGGSGNCISTYVSDSKVGWFNGSGVSETTVGLISSTATWYLVVVRKATGNVAPRWSTYDYNANTWNHQDGAALVDGGAPGAGGSIRLDFQVTAEFWNGKLAVSAAWADSVRWSSDATGDAQIEASGLKSSLQAWVAASPTALWRWDQPVADGVQDIVGSADQTSISGTTRVTNDDPPGFSFGAFVYPLLFPGLPRR